MSSTTTKNSPSRRTVRKLKGLGVRGSVTPQRDEQRFLFLHQRTLALPQESGRRNIFQGDAKRKQDWGERKSGTHGVSQESILSRSGKCTPPSKPHAWEAKNEKQTNSRPHPVFGACGKPSGPVALGSNQCEKKKPKIDDIRKGKSKAKKRVLKLRRSPYPESVSPKRTPEGKGLSSGD